MEDLLLDLDGYPVKSYKEGERVISEGGVQGPVYVLQKGCVDVIAGERTVGSFDVPGTIFGEISVMLDCEHTASVVCTEDSDFHVIDDFVEMVKKKPDMIQSICLLIQRRLMHTNYKVLEDLPLDMRLAGCQVDEFEKGDTIIEEGKPAETMYILKEGKAKVISSGNVMSRIKTPGAMFGEIPVLSKSTYSASVIADSKCTLYAISDLPEFYESNPAAALQLSGFLATRLTDVIDQFTTFRAEVMKSRSRPTGKRLLNALAKFDQFLTGDVAKPFGGK